MPRVTKAQLAAENEKLKELTALLESKLHKVLGRYYQSVEIPEELKSYLLVKPSEERAEKMSQKTKPKMDLPAELIIVKSDTFDKLIDRNVKTVSDVFSDDPAKVLVSVQIEEDQIEHLAKGLSGRSRRLIPLPVLAKLLQKLQ